MQDQDAREKAKLQIKYETLQHQLDSKEDTLKELIDENLKLKSEITALHSHSFQSIPFTEQEQLPFMATQSPEVYNIESTLVGQRFSLATTLPDSSGQDVEPTLASQRLSLAPILLDLSSQDVEHIPIGQSSSLATPPHTDIFRDSQVKALMLLDDKDDCQVQGPRGSLPTSRSSTSTQKLKDDLASLKQSLSEISDALSIPQEEKPNPPESTVIAHPCKGQGHLTQDCPTDSPAPSLGPLHSDNLVSLKPVNHLNVMGLY